MQHASQRAQEHADTERHRKGGVLEIAFADAVRVGREEFEHDRMGRRDAAIVRRDAGKCFANFASIC